MKTTHRKALLIGGAAVLAVAGGVSVWQVTEHREEQAFITEQYAQLEADKAELEASPTPQPFNQDRAIEECQALYTASTDARPLGDAKFGEASTTAVSTDLYSISGYASGNDREDGYACTALRDGLTWQIELL